MPFILIIILEQEVITVQRAAVQLLARVQFQGISVFIHVIMCFNIQLQVLRLPLQFLN